MSTVEETVEVAVPVRTAYDQWTQFMSFPRFMTAVRRVEQLRPAVVLWTVGLGPVLREFGTEILEQVPDSHLEWRSLGRRHPHRGEVRFRSSPDGGTAITARIRLHPRGPTGVLAAVPWAGGRLVRQELARFKYFVEGLGEAEGGWRGTIRGGQVRHPEAEPPRSRVPHWPVG